MAATDSPGGFARRLNEERFPWGCRVRCRTMQGLLRDGRVVGRSRSSDFARVVFDGNKSDSYVTYANMQRISEQESSNDTSAPKVSKLVTMTEVEAYAPIEVLEAIEQELCNGDDSLEITEKLDKLFAQDGLATKVINSYYERDWARTVISQFENPTENPVQPDAASFGLIMGTFEYYECAVVAANGVRCGERARFTFTDGNQMVRLCQKCAENVHRGMYGPQWKHTF